MAATDPDAKGGAFYGPRGLGHLGGPPAEQKLYTPLRSTEDATRIWGISERLTEHGVRDHLTVTPTCGCAKARA